MPRPRQPTAILAFRGTFKKNPSRLRAREGEPVDNAPIGEPPERLSDGRKAVWRELLGQLVPGVVLQSDAVAFEELVCLVARAREQWLAPQERAQMIKLFTLFGMTPADRSRVKVSPEIGKKPNAFGALGA